MKNPVLAQALAAMFMAAAVGTPLRADIRTSANYSLSAETLDAGGVAQAGSTNYALAGTALGQTCAGAPGNAGPLLASANYTARPGFVGTIYNVLGLTVAASPASVNEGGATTQLSAAPLLDDNTRLTALASTAVAWSSISGGPVASISSAGVAATANVYQNTLATVRASYQGFAGQGSFIVVNVGTDDYGSYAGDGIDDAWQVQYFGVNNPLAAPDVDADGTGQNNLFKYLAGLNPLDPTSRFVLTISGVAGQPGTKTLSFSPVYSGRTYTLQFTGSLTQSNWTTLSNATSSDNGTTRTETDLDANAVQRFYRVQISLPLSRQGALQRPLSRPAVRPSTLSSLRPPNFLLNMLLPAARPSAAGWANWVDPLVLQLW